MLIGVLRKKTLAELDMALRRLDASLYDLLELRLDSLEDFSPQGIAALRPPLPVIYTLRRQEEGGGYPWSEKKRLEHLHALMRLHPARMDLEASLSVRDIAALRVVSPQTGIILSRHYFASTPPDLDAVLAAMRARAPEGVIYKIAAMAQNTLDALDMLLFCKRSGPAVLGISMGQAGESTRILAPVYHCGLCYCPVEEASAPGQIPAATLRGTYNFASLNPRTAVYGLLGDPVEQSSGHALHNALNKQHGLEAVYVKWPVRGEELPGALERLHRLGVSGLSVTMPHKRAVLPLLARLDEAARAIGAANTLTRTEQGYTGSNTDGEGAMRALRQAGTDPEHKRVFVLGAGGAAAAFLHAAAPHARSIRVFNRTPGKDLPAGLRSLSWSDLKSSGEADLLVNALPFDAAFDFSALSFPPGGTALDLSYNRESAFLHQAALHGCRCLDGSAMFREQAMLQRDIWGL
ncbi:MAG: type I 3-dehydroquinate dehydratase [Deltaproteobacteria bacterium]|jgi:3-dehydroquinate dehydratase/shikimate dehydrogenase|nr:type I 3-dehydroquinate dehydratase [Deltaproteobacteria bacterium]